MNIKTIVFDLGGVLIDWNPRYLYRKIFENRPEQMEFFLNNICTSKWNAQQDAGRPFSEAVKLLQTQHPEYADAIAAYDKRWEEMLGDANRETVCLLQRFRQSAMPLYALTNWSAEKFPIARKRFDFLNWFDDILVSGEVKMKKPDPRIFQHFLAKYQLIAEETLFIDDSSDNVISAGKLGLQTIHFRDSAQLAAQLCRYGF